MNTGRSLLRNTRFIPCITVKFMTMILVSNQLRALSKLFLGQVQSSPNHLKSLTFLFMSFASKITKKFKLESSKINYYMVSLLYSKLLY
jgi:hypothetical protein